MNRIWLRWWCHCQLIYHGYVIQRSALFLHFSQFKFSQSQCSQGPCLMCLRLPPQMQIGISSRLESQLGTGTQGENFPKTPCIHYGVGPGQGNQHTTSTYALRSGFLHPHGVRHIGGGFVAQLCLCSHPRVVRHLNVGLATLSQGQAVIPYANGGLCVYYAPNTAVELEHYSHILWVTRCLPISKITNLLLPLFPLVKLYSKNVYIKEGQKCRKFWNLFRTFETFAHFHKFVQLEVH